MIVFLNIQSSVWRQKNICDSFRRMMFDFFERIISPFKDEPLTQPPAGFLRFIWFFVKDFKWYLLAISVLAAIVGIGEAVLFYYIGYFVDILSVSTYENFYVNHKYGFIFFLILTMVILPLCIGLHALILNQTLRVNFPTKVRYKLHRYLLRQSVSYFSEEFSGRVSQKLMQTTISLRDTVLKFSNVVVRITVYFITMMVMLAETDIYLMVIMGIWLIVYLYLMYYFIPRLSRLSSECAEKRSLMVGGIVDSYTNIQTVKLFSQQNREEKYSRQNMQACADSEFKMMRMVSKFNVSVQIINQMLISMLVIVAIILWSNNVVMVGAVAISLGLAIRTANLSQWVMWEVGMLFENIGNVTNGIKSLAKPISITDPKEPVKPVSFKGDISFRNVVFSYNNKVKVFNGLNLHIKHGERIGIVGPSGSGKSTLVNLLLRLYEVNSGSVAIDGVDIRNMTQDELHQAIAMVTQDTSLLHRSVRDNITYGRDFKERDEEIEVLVRSAASQAKAIDFIELLSDSQGNSGFDTQVGERGVRLSGGQRQRIALARVILKNSPILILDEATSALDSEVEAAIQENLEVLMKNRTVIAIAHRLSTIASMDRLIVLENGEIIEQGTHAELLALNGVYARLWQKQTDGFLANK